jgi:isopentenyldiphosphate isomerase
MGQKIPVVDSRDRVIGAKERSQMKQRDIYRVAALWITNKQGEILLAQRSKNKKNDPGAWHPTVAGTIEQGETYLSNIKKEISEELGIKLPLTVKRGPKTMLKTKHRHFTQWFFLTITKPISKFKIDHRETAKLKWFKPAELIQLVKAKPKKFVPNMAQYLKLFVK